MSTTPVDLSHHLSQEARLRKPNAMKQIWRLARRKPNMISLANGDPHSSLYPIQSLTFNVASVAEKDPVATWRAGGSSAPTHTLTSSRDEASVLPVRTAFQYTTGAGLIETQQAVTELTRFYHNPPDHAATLTLGNGDGVTKCFRLLGSPGDHFLADEFTFSSLANAAVPHGIKWVSVKIDEGGLIPEELENILVNWSEERGPRPHVLYTVPCGQNPTGSTLSVERRKKIYELARRFDLLIIEDDPYYFLQYTSEPSSPEAEAAPAGSEGAVSSRGLAPSFLSLDTDGRVLRVDSFSKVFAPGMRLGVITSSPFFHAHLVALTDSSTQHPHAFGQLFLAELLGPAGWTLAGFDAWVRSLRDEYRRRRDVFLGFFETEVAPLGLVDASVPEAGMFVWTKINVERHPRFRREAGEAKAQGARTNCRQLMEELFELCLDNGLVVMPAWVFALPTDPKYDDPENPVEDRMNYFRLTFAGTEEAMEDGLKIFGQSLKEFFVEKPKPVEN
ncbi:L-tyrosine:2-oxoglutarate aminotransferase [Fomitopsis serialis]|uniref:L-tyrosine:2-oxoglutarate aminotransferase n=1 Tax=Fomitopsis serialis TaxID=139415 RepID=UPI0020084315|nr:L-tyrosine:2-oxoglutarate aminotransferase [Neoantrodia serialis]KAH9930640.1 L-tyrosine:2-oxoglutarate aminotransferase [Neoantrodia serialis]